MGRSIPRGVMGGLWISEGCGDLKAALPQEGCSPAKAGVQSGPPPSQGNKEGAALTSHLNTTPAKAGAQLE
jgi:hypothetical protein